MLSSDCTKASNPFRGLHFLINPRNWQDMNNLTHTCTGQMAMQLT